MSEDYKGTEIGELRLDTDYPLRSIGLGLGREVRIKKDENVYENELRST